MSATVARFSPPTIEDQVASAVQVLERLVIPKTDDVVSDEETDSFREIPHKTDCAVTPMANVCRGAHRLPPELLRIIFLQALRPVDLSRSIQRCASVREHPDDSIDLGWPSEHKRVCDVLALTHVCQYWRSVALAFPELWQSLAFSSRDAASTFLSRVGDKPLSVLATATGPSGAVWFGDMYAKCAPMVRQLLWVSSGGKRPNAQRGKLLPDPELDIGLAPMPERLCIAAGVGDPNYGSPRIVFHADTSRLKYLSFMSCHWYPRSHCPSLTHLILTERRIYSWYLGAFLDYCPNLQTLICRTAESWIPLVPPHIIKLPHLRRVSLECASFPDEHLLGFLAKLDFDRSRAAIRVSFKKRRSGEQRDLLVAPPPQQDTLGVQPRQNLPYTHLCIRAVGPPRGTASFMVFATSATGGVCLNGLSTLDPLVQHSLPLQDVTELWVDGLTKEMPDMLKAWRGALASLRTLVVVRRPLPPGTEGREDVPAAPAGVAGGASRGPAVSGPDLASLEMGLRRLEERWDTEDGVFGHLKANFEDCSLPGSHLVRIFVSDGEGSVRQEPMEAWMTVAGQTRSVPVMGGAGEIIVHWPRGPKAMVPREVEEMPEPTVMLIPEVCREDPELTAWEAW
ncbi:hypothetical protein OH76DRAFT_1554975 [Lentinus brumalis]|uniref:Uncharacterized protein n=1 Tax=Lentinus brumalis TaxID=2498619 RepID=A0A371DGE3_9APHY|nr:hypothetical protein OH76DRAFT_1554975 [Polyporus brumalis]